MRSLTRHLHRVCMPQRTRIAALGSSFASGPTIYPLENDAAQRSKRNYAHQLAGKLDADLTDLSVAGATLLNLLNETQIANGVAFPPQLDSLPKETDIVTLTCGGNDLNYIGDLMDTTLRSYFGPPKWSSQVASYRGSPQISLSELTERYCRVVDKIHGIAPKAKVYLVQYLSLIGNDTKPLYDVALSLDSTNHFDKVAALLARANEEVAARFSGWVEVIPVAKASKDHALGSPTPWVNGFSTGVSGPASYHPNLAGHTAVAELLYEQIKGKSQ